MNQPSYPFALRQDRKTEKQQGGKTKWLCLFCNPNPQKTFSYIVKTEAFCLYAMRCFAVGIKLLQAGGKYQARLIGGYASNKTSEPR